MKIIGHSLGLVLLTGVIFSCQPKDVKVDRPGNNGANVNANSANLSSLEFDKLLSLTLDRQFEALHLLKAVLNPTYAESKNLKLSQDKLGNSVLRVLKPITYKKEEARDLSIYSVDYEVQALQLDENGKLVSLVLKNVATSTPSSISFNSSGVDFASKALSEFVSIRISTTPGQYIVSFDRLDDTSSKADRQSNLIVTGVAILTWDGLVESLDQPLAMNLTKFYVDRKGYKTGYMRFAELQTKDLTVSVNECISVNGNVTLIQKIGGKNPFDKITSVDYTDSSIAMMTSGQATIRYTAKECAKRSVIDFTKML